MNEDVKRELELRGARLAAITRHPSWAELVAEFDRKKEKHLKVLLTKLMSGKPYDQREIDYFRGFWAGASWILANPAQADRTLKAALANAAALDLPEGEE